MMDGKRLPAALCVCICIVLAACSSKADRIESGLRKGKQYVATADWDKAAIEARNVLQIDPKNADAFLIVGAVEDGRGAFRNAYANYSRALELAPSSADAKLGLARLYLLSGDLTHGAQMISDLMTTRADDVRVRTLGVMLLARQGHADQAVAGADLLATSGQALPVTDSLALAGLYFNAHRQDAALGMLDRAIDAQPHDIRLLQMAAEIAASGGAPDAAQAVRAAGYYARATSEAPKNDALWRDWASMEIRAHDSAQAESVLRKSLESQPDSAARIVALLRFDATFHGAAQAEKEHLDAVAAHPKLADVKLAVVDFYRAQKRSDDAIRVLQTVVDDDKTGAAGAIARGQLAALWIAAGKTDLARADLTDLLKANPRDATGLLLRARLEIADGDSAAAIADLRSAVKDKPGSVEIADLLARAHRAAGEPELAREALADAVKFNGADPRAHLLLAADLAQAHEYAAALPELDAAIRVDPSNQVARRTKVEIAMASNDFPAAEAAAHEIETALPTDPAGHLMRGRVLAHEKKVAAALGQYDAAAQLAPHAAEPLIAAVGLLTAQHRYADAQARIDALQKSNPNSALARELRGELALATGHVDLAQQAFQQLVDLPGAPPSAYKNLAATMVARNELATALATLDRGEKAYPDDVTLASARAEWLGRAGRTDDAIHVYEQILKRAPDSEIAANNLAYVLVETRRDPASLDQALKLAKRFAVSNQAGYVDTLGLVQYRLGFYDKAVVVLARAASLAPADAGVQLHYGMALYKKGDVQQGGDIVRKVLGGKTVLPDQDEAKALLSNS